METLGCCGSYDYYIHQIAVDVWSWRMKICVFVIGVCREPWLVDCVFRRRNAWIAARSNYRVSSLALSRGSSRVVLLVRCF